MLYILFFILTIILLFKYGIRRKGKQSFLFSPDFTVISVFAFSSLVAAFNIDKWGDISFVTFAVIISSIIFFEIGVVTTNGKSSNIACSTQTIFYKSRDITMITIVISILMAIVTILQYIETIRLVGVSGLGLLALSTMARQSYYAGDLLFDYSFLVWQGLYLSKAVAFCYIFIISFNKIFQNQKIITIYIIPIFIYILQIILLTGRSEFIYLIYGSLVIPYILSKIKNGWSKQGDFKYIKYILYGLAIFFFVFISIANLRTEDSSNSSDTISVYVGSSILALDEYINRFGLDSTSSFWGEMTMPLVYNIMRTLGLSKNTTIDALPITDLNGDITNIYTSLYRYIHDFGIVFTFVIVFLIGRFYGSLFNKNRSNMYPTVYIILFAYLSYPLTEFSIEERFLSTLITARTIYVCIYIILFYKFIIKKRFFSF